MEGVPIGQKDFELMFSRSSIKEYVNEIYGLLLDFDLPEINFSVEGIPVSDFDERLDYCIALTRMLVSLTVKGIESKEYSTINPDYVDPLVNAIFDLLKSTIKAIEDEMDENAITADVRVDQYGAEYYDYEDYMESHITTEYEKRLEDIMIDTFGTGVEIPRYEDLKNYHAPLDLDSITNVLNMFVAAKEKRDRLKRAEKGNINMNMFLCMALEYGLQPTNKVFRDLYDALDAFGYIDKEQVKLHADDSLNRSPDIAKSDFLRSRYKQLKKKGVIG